MAFTGAGGKTTIMLQLAREALAAGLRVLVTVSTRMYAPDPAEFGQPLYDAAQLQGKHLAVYAGGYDAASGKLLGASSIPSGFDLVLVEADGAAGKPLTAPLEHEPVIPSSTTTVLAVAGLDAIGLSLEKMHRPEVIARLAGVTPDAPITPAVVAAVLSHPEGNVKGRPAGARVVYVLNKADDGARKAASRETALLLASQVFVTSYGQLTVSP